MNILAYVKHQLNTDNYIWQVFNVPDNISNIIDYLTSRGYATKEYREYKTKQRQPRTKRVIEPSGGQHLCEVWRRSVIKGHCDY